MSHFLSRFVAPLSRPGAAQQGPTAPTRSWLALCLVFAVGTAATSRASHEQTKWYVSGNDCELQVLQHARLDGATRLPPCDHLRLHAGPGTYAYAVWPLAPSTVISELDIRVAVRSTRTRHQLLLRVVLPRSLQDDGYPVSFLLAGSISECAGTWQMLRVDDITQELQEQVRILRSHAEAYPIDPREAYVDLVVVNIYGGPGTSETWIRDPLVEGRVSVDGQTHAHELLPTSFERPLPDQQLTEIRLVGDLLRMNGRPFFPRVIEDQGESWQNLKRLGFNTIRLSAPATAEQILQAERLDMWLLAPPPRNWPGAYLSQHFRRILAWDLSAAPSPQSFDETRRADRKRSRPIVCQAQGDLSCVVPADIQLNRRDTLGSNLTDRQYREWLLSRSRYTRPGTPHWCTVQTEPLAAIQRQVAELGYPEQATALHVDPIDLQKTALVAAVSGMRGLVFTSRNRLDADSAHARLRATTLQRLNLQLDLIEPWISAGTPTASGSCSDDAYSVFVLGVERAWLVVVLQDTVADGGEMPIEVTVPGVPDSSDVYGIDRRGLRRYLHQRVTGGLRFQLPRPAPINFAIVTRDALALSKLERTWREQSAAATELDRQIAESLVGLYSQQLAELPAQATPSDVVRRLGFVEQRQLTWAASSVNHDFAQVRECAEDVLCELPRLRHSLRHVAVNEPLDSPLNCYDSTLHLHWKFLADLSPIAGQFNLLPHGDFENLTATRAAGWQLMERCATGIVPKLSFSHDRSLSGGSHVRLSALPEQPEKAPAAVQAIPVWLQSPGIPLRKGDLFRVTGHVRVEDTIRASTDGALVFDTLGGTELAFRTKQTDGWQKFSFIRAATASQDMHVILALSGLGTVEFDQLEVTRIRRMSNDLIDSDGRMPTATLSSK